jgi:signal transduction histidine kinase
MNAGLAREDLRSLFLFEALSDDKLDWLATRGTLRVYEPGATVCREGAPATELFVLLDGEVTLSRLSNGEDMIINQTSYRGSFGGAIRAYSEPPDAPYSHSLVARRTSSFFVLDGTDFATFMRTWFPMAVHLLDGARIGERAVESTIQEREHLARLGRLSADLAHEMNNPATATVRGTAQLRDSSASIRRALGAIAGHRISADTLAQLVSTQQATIAQVAKAPPAQRTAVQESDLEAALADRLEELRVPLGYDLAPVFVSAGLDEGWLDQIVRDLGDELARDVLGWLASTLESESLMDEIEEAGNRISALVAAVKQYSAMDTASQQVVDVHAGLESTVVILTRKLDGMKVERDYDRSLPRVPAYAAELNQVWTILIDNAVEATGGSGRLLVRTRRDGDHLVVEVGDDGPGIPEEARARVFDAFFTTKPAGQNSGLGLDNAQRIVTKHHQGVITFTTGPTGTLFEVRLPLQNAA